MTPAGTTGTETTASGVAAMRDEPDETWDAYNDETPGETSRDEWSEEDWEAFFDQQDVLNAKYRELHETLRKHPRRDELIAHEMHWNLPEQVLDQMTGEPPDPRASRELAAIPAYAAAQKFALDLDRAIVARLRARAQTDEDAARTCRAAYAIPAEIAGGHDVGYERETLCGNIVCCKRAMANVLECLDGLLALRARGILPPKVADALLARGRELKQAVEQRIEELRARLWWR